MGGKAQRQPPEGRGQQGARRGLGERGCCFCPSEPPPKGPPRARLLGPCKAQRLVWQG